VSPEPRIPWEEWIQAAEDPARAADKPEALDDLLVLDLSQCHYGALLTATYLGELGAEVIKVEPPQLKWPCRPAGYHNRHVLQKYFGYGPRRLAELHREGIVWPGA